MTIQKEVVLVLAPHTDDAEFGCGGTIIKLLENDCEVHVVAFSCAEESVPSHLPKEINKTHMLEAMQILGIAKTNTIIKNYPVRHFPQHRQEILEDLVKLNKEINPSVVFLPSTFDTHQDHQVICQEGFRAFKRTTLFGYEMPWNNLMFSTNCFVNLDEKHIDKKLKSLDCYISQMGRDYISADFIRSLARTRGGQMGRTYAEAFEVVRINL